MTVIGGRESKKERPPIIGRGESGKRHGTPCPYINIKCMIDRLTAIDIILQK
jgi:hypothetical protein